VSDLTLISGALNFRDTGGLPAGPGVTRHGMLFRSGNLATVDERGLEKLRGLALRRIIDLRDDEEVVRAPSIVGEGTETIRVPLFHGSVGSFFQRDVGLDELYRSMIDDSADRVVDVVRGVIGVQPVLVHCTVGKDRTGVTVALTLLAAGVDLEAVVADYARTERMLPEARNREVVRRIRSVHPDATRIEELATRSPARVMSAFMSELTERYGAPVEFLRAHGLADDEIAELRRVLVAPSS
jgi:protein-tyrosine phosphatase